MKQTTFAKFLTIALLLIALGYAMASATESFLARVPEPAFVPTPQNNAPLLP